MKLKCLFIGHDYEVKDERLVCLSCGKVKNLPCEHQWREFSKTKVLLIKECMVCGKFKEVDIPHIHHWVHVSSCYNTYKHVCDLCGKEQEFSYKWR